jgi:RimJ/RimL family protein N-acetyltransferase
MSAIETERLLLEPWSEPAGAMLARLAALPDVMRFVGRGVPLAPDEAAELHERALAHWREHGFGWRVAAERASGARVGLIALNFIGPWLAPLAADEYEIGWWIDPASWGRGYATEGGRAIRAEAWELGAPSVIARIQPGNVTSERVAAALGLGHEADVTGRHGEPVRVFRGFAPGAARGRGRG